MNLRIISLSAGLLAAGWLSLAAGGAALAQDIPGGVALDGSLGSLGPVTLEGPNYVIGPEAGQLEGANLFHSFSRFAIGTGESAAFTGPESVASIIGRVTGGETSTIDGALISEIPGADLYLFNPSGILFGSNASLNVDGSVHLSTADYMTLADGGRFPASPAGGALLTSAPPAAFGFGEKPTGAISFQGRGDISLEEWEANPATVSVPPGKTLSVTASDIRVDGATAFFVPDVDENGAPLEDQGQWVRQATLAAPEGRVILTAATGSGEVSLAAEGNPAVGSTAGGDIALVNGAFIDAGGEAGGSVVIHAGRFYMDGGSMIAADTGDGDAGALSITAGEAELADGSVVQSLSHGAGRSADIAVTAAGLSLTGGAALASVALASGPGGDIVLGVSDTLSVAGETASGDYTSEISALTFDGSPEAGNGGNVTITAGTVRVANGGQIGSATFGGGNGGSVSVTAESLEMSGETSFGVISKISANTQDINEGAGSGGGVTVSVNELAMSGGGQISSSSHGAGAGGLVDVTVSGAARLSGASANGEFPTGLYSNAQTTEAPAGPGGNVTLTAGRLELSDGALLSAETKGPGPGGDVTLVAGEALLNGGGLSAASSGDGDAGTISLTTAGHLVLAHDGFIATATDRADGGDVRVSVGGRFQATDSALTTSVNAENGNGGNISLDADFLVLDRSSVIARAVGGDGGNIDIATTGIFRFPPEAKSPIDASSRLGVDGIVTVHSPETDVGAALAVLPSSPLDAQRWASVPCAARLGENVSHLVLGGRDAVAWAVDDWLPAFPGLAVPPSPTDEKEAGQ